MTNVFESVNANKQKSIFIVLGFVCFVIVASVFIGKGIGYYYGYETTGLELTGIALVISGVMSFASYYWSDKIILSLSGARKASKKRDFLLYTVTENLSLAAGIPIPELYVIEDTAMNAFATGRDPDHAVVCATSGLVSRLNRTELEGVIAHELSHVANYDTRLMSIVTVLVGVVTLLGDWLLRASFYGRGSKDDDNKSNGVIFIAIGFAFALLSPIIAQIIQLAVSRRREYLADAHAVKITRQPSGLISALKKLDGDREPLEAANKATAHLYIVNPLKNLSSDVRGWFANLFNTHPPIAERIKVLEQMS